MTARQMRLYFRDIVINFSAHVMAEPGVFARMCAPLLRRATFSCHLQAKRVQGTQGQILPFQEDQQ